MTSKAIVICSECGKEVELIRFKKKQGFVFKNKKPICNECAEK